MRLGTQRDVDDSVRGGEPAAVEAGT